MTWYPIYSRIPSNRKDKYGIQFLDSDVNSCSHWVSIYGAVGMIKLGTRGIISYYAKKYGKFITRDFKWDNKCVFSDTHIIYFDVSAKGYRRANRPIRMSEYTVQ